ncbi:MAG: hypothetical protein Q8N03_01360 [Ignavibacteria bacterium]|nr:hypothetical protein [Ignavibacteria bacterium]
MRAFVYILGASSKPDQIKCTVPYEIDDKEIFFGPCKKRLRQKLKSEVDKNGKFNSETYFIGLNAGNSDKVRKIVWAGKIQSHYTFKQANQILRGAKYAAIKTVNLFPLHVIPIKNGYQLKSNLHSKNDKWIWDLVSNKESVVHDEDSNSIILKKGSSFNRDICFIFSNIFFAKSFESGIEISDEILDLFRTNQPDKKKIDSYAIFGYRKDLSVDGKIGGWLELDDPSSRNLIKLIKIQAKQIKKKSNSSQTRTIHKTKQNHRGGCK